MKKTSSVQHELSITFNTFYLLLIDGRVTYFLYPRVFHTSLIQTSLIFAIQIDRFYMPLTGNQINEY